MAGKVLKNAVVTPEAVKVQKPAVGGSAPAVKKPTPAATKAAQFEVADNRAKKAAEVPVARVGGQQSRIDAFLKKGAINSPEALLAKLDGMSDSEAATFMGTLFADSIKGVA